MSRICVRVLLLAWADCSFPERRFAFSIHTPLKASLCPGLSFQSLNGLSKVVLLRPRPSQCLEYGFSKELAFGSASRDRTTVMSAFQPLASLPISCSGQSAAAGLTVILLDQFDSGIAPPKSSSFTCAATRSSSKMLLLPKGCQSTPSDTAVGEGAWATVSRTKCCRLLNCL